MLLFSIYSFLLQYYLFYYLFFVTLVTLKINDMPKVTFSIDKTNTDKNGYSPIKANVAIDYKKKTIAVGKVKPRYWNKTKPRISSKHPTDDGYNPEKVNTYLDNFQKEAKEYFDECKLNNIEVTLDIVSDYFKGQKLNLNPVKIDFWKAYDEYIRTMELTTAVNTNRMQKSNKKKLEEFESKTGYKMNFDTVNLTFFDRLSEYILITKGYEYNYLPAIIRRLKAFMTWSYKRNYHTSIKYKEFSAQEKEGSIIYLTFSELQQLINFTFENAKYSKVRDFYCFGCLTGARYSDLKRLTKDNISEGVLKFTTEKTNIDVAIPIFPELQTIINRYPEQYRLLPIISNQKANKYIKEACELAEINSPTEHKTFIKNTTVKEYKPKFELIGSHTARKTFVCLAHARGTDLKTIMDITGIQDQQTLKRYLDVLIDTKRDNLTKIFENLTPKKDPDPNEEALKVLKETLTKMGFKTENIDNLFSQFKDPSEAATLDQAMQES
jgi:integrase